MSIKSILISSFAVLFSITAYGQSWEEKMFEGDANFYEVQSLANAYFSQRDTLEKGKGWKPYKRWEWFTSQRVYPSGDLGIMEKAMGSYLREFIENYDIRSSDDQANWSFMGPSVVPENAGGAGRSNFVRFDPQDPTILWTGSPGGGLWKSPDNGESWINWNTDHLPVIGCTDLAINPSNSDIMYLATGDGYGSDTYSIGILKSIDGGLTWEPSGLSWEVAQTRRIRRILIDPTNPDILITATSNGIFRSTDAGENWTRTQSGNFYTLEFKPGDTQRLYAGSTAPFFSNDGGISWNQSTVIEQGGGIRRLILAVTPADPNVVYLLAANSSDNGFLGLFKSTDSGLTYTKRSDSPNVMGWSSNGDDDGGQGWYTLSMAVSPVDADRVIVGGVNIWGSIDGGSTWNINAHWWGDQAPYVHADIHHLIYAPGSTNTIYTGCDGGVFRTKTNGADWEDLSDGLETAQLYKIGASATNPALVISGWQDNGTNLVRDSNWRRVIGGDGMECIIDYTDENIMYGALYYGNVRRSTNGGNNFNTIVSSGDNNGVNSSGLWVTPYVLHPKDPATLLIGKDELYRSNNYGDTWEQLGSIGGGGLIRVISYAPSNPDIIYVARTNTLSISTDGGLSFQVISQGLPNLTITAITVSNIDPNRVYVSFSGYNPEEKVYISTNAGGTWSNYTSGLPNLPVNYILYGHGSPNGIYAATDVGVYYRDESFQAWTIFSEGIPNVVVTELEIHYPTSKIRAATYGRGQWESDIFGGVPSPPVADFFVNATSACSGSSISISNLSQNGVYDWKWSFEGNPSGDVSAFNPSLIWEEAGTYKVELIIINPAGSDTIVKEVIVKETPILSFDPPNPIVCAGDEISITASGATSFLWNLGLGPGAVKTFVPTQTRTYTVTGNNTGCLNTSTLTVTVVEKPSITAETSTTELCEGESIELIVDGAPIYEWLNGSGAGPLLEVTPVLGSELYVVGINDDGCRDSVKIDIIVNPLPALVVTPASLVICEGETAIFIAEGGDSYQWSNGLGNDPNITVQPTESTTYEVTAFTNKNCQATISVPIEVNSIPDVQVVSSHSKICKGDLILLQASGADFYTWDGQANASEIEIVADESRLFTVVGTSNQGCSMEATVFVEVIALEANFKSWPDPNCNSGYYQLIIGPETAVTGYNIPPLWSIDLYRIPGVWQFNQIGSGDLLVSLENTQGQCDIKLTPPQGVIQPEQNLIYTSCSSSLSISDECSNTEGNWYVVNKSDGLVAQIIPSNDGNLPNVSEENLVQNYYFFQCQNSCETFIGPSFDVLSGTQPCDPVEPGDLIFGFRLVPNPASDLFTIQIQHPRKDRMEVMIVDVIGRKVFEGYYDHEGGLIQIPIETKNWQSGTFVVSVFDSTGKRLQEKLIIH